MNAFLQDPVNVYGVALVIFLILAYLFLRKPIVGWLDSEIGKISAELNTARELRAEAEASLAECKVKQAKAESEAKMILDMAKKQAEAMRRQAEEELASVLTHQQHLATERIHMAEDKAVKAVRDAAVTVGMELARKSLSQDLTDSEAAALIEEAINEIPAFKKAK